MLENMREKKLLNREMLQESLGRKRVSWYIFPTTIIADSNVSLGKNCKINNKTI